jgi:hypothetical protein
MATYIMDCLKRQIWIVFSWGFNSPVALKNGLRFSVNGFIHKGIVEIIYCHSVDLFEINLIKNGEIKKHIAGVYIDELIDILDRHIEKDEGDENYTNRVKQEYSLL